MPLRITFPQAISLVILFCLREDVVGWSLSNWPVWMGGIRRKILSPPPFINYIPPDTSDTKISARTYLNSQNNMCQQLLYIGIVCILKRYNIIAIVMIYIYF